MISADLPSLLQSFFTERLLRQRQASPHTIAGYRDSFRLLLQFAKERLGKAPSKIRVEDLDAPFLGLFLEHLEDVRKNSARTRNARLAAIHSFFQYVALEEPAYALHCQRILAMPNKRHERRPIEFLNREEFNSLLAVPDLSTWLGRRDRALLLVAVQTLRPETTTTLHAWLRERHGQPEQPVFPSIRGGRLSRDAIERLITKYTNVAKQTCPSLKRKRVSPHVLRHAAAMDLLQHGVDRSVIALWLGHESMETTQIYLHADMRLKEKALSRTTPLGVKPGRYRPDDKLLAFLESL